MVLWNDVDKNLIEVHPTGKEKSRFVIDGKPLRFQLPRGLCQWGASAYKSLNIEITNRDFVEWWCELERRICPQEPFKSNLQCGSLRIKIDDGTYIFDENSKQVSPEIREGLFRGQELSCLIDIESNYFFNGNWGLTVRAYQVRFYGPEMSAQSLTASAAPVLPKGICAFLESAEFSS
jgi:hypothetical protein